MSVQSGKSAVTCRTRSAYRSASARSASHIASISIRLNSILQLTAALPVAKQRGTIVGAVFSHQLELDLLEHLTLSFLRQGGGDIR